MDTKRVNTSCRQAVQTMKLVKIKLKNKYLRGRVFGVSIHIKHGWLYRYIVKKCLQKRWAAKLPLIQNKSRIRVGFLVAEAAKWGYQSVYDAFDADPRFEPVIMTTKLGQEHRNGTTHYKTMADCRDFFVARGMNVESAYDEGNKQYIPLTQMNVDIVFYEQPWDVVECQHPFTVSKYAITCYSSYGFDLMNYDGSYMEHFHRWIDCVFTVSNATYEHIKNIAKRVSNVSVVGWSKLDVYQDMQKNTTRKPIVIYAPHHSFEAHGLNLATFQYNGQEILNLAKKYADKFDWVFKPHPRLKHALVLNKIMTAEQADEYWGEWKKLGTICDGGDYFQIFNDSCAMITDCCSFLGEYLPTGNPVFHLINQKAKFNDVARSFIGAYYQIYDNAELINEFERVLINADDHKKSMRKDKIPLVFDKNEKTGKKIYKHISQFLKN